MSWWDLIDEAGFSSWPGEFEISFTLDQGVLWAAEPDLNQAGFLNSRASEEETNV